MRCRTRNDIEPQRGSPFTTAGFARMVERAAASAGLKLKAHPHMLRHACVGHYENGDTLVIDTIGISAKSFVDNYRTPHTDQLHVVERWKLAADGKTVDVSIFVEDPGAFTTPWTAVQRWRRAENAPISPMACNENNGDFFSQGLVPVPEATKPDF